MRPQRVDGQGVAAELMAARGGASPSPWRTPTPYLFLGFAVMMGLIVVALLVLICTRRRSSSSRAAAGEKAPSVRGVLVPLDREAPGVVVIMAGDVLPSFLASAKPLAVAAFPAPGAEAHGDDAAAV
ncbi:hypothetical protein HU200_058930 [Digitaria exilis]|uniref:Uncharacterized protein n=1 Tax=Digitaria exilis TaxID=1010633 RepID=A0A835A8C3_9POAL|nr:hypothetical protein HU200_058930 [Digitaria exilis]